MSKTLHDILVDYIDTVEPESKHKDKIIERLEDDITDEVVSEQIEEIYIREKKAFKKTILREKIKNAKEVAIVAIVIGFFVGLLVNQFTEIIAWGKSQVGEYSLIVTGLCIIGIWLVIQWLYKHWFVDKISDMLEEGEDKNNE